MNQQVLDEKKNQSHRILNLFRQKFQQIKGHWNFEFFFSKNPAN